MVSVFIILIIATQFQCFHFIWRVIRIALNFNLFVSIHAGPGIEHMIPFWSESQYMDWLMTDGVRFTERVLADKKRLEAKNILEDENAQIQVPMEE